MVWRQGGMKMIDPRVLIANFRFAHPFFLLLLLLIPLLAIVTRRVRAIRRPATLRYADISLISEQARSWRVRARPLLKVLRWTGLALLLIGLARPQVGETRQIIRGEGVDIALALDISGSMASLDFQPDNRLVAAKAVINEFIAERQFDRIGLVVFANEAFAQSPLTIDHDVLSRLLGGVELATDLRLTDGTAIGLGVATAANMLKNSKVESRIIILLTDGVNNAGAIDPFTAANAAKALGIKIYTIGMGKQGEVPFPTRNIFGQPVVTYVQSEIDEEMLQQISAETGGKYFRATDTDALRGIYDEINQLEKSEIEIDTFSRYDELALWALIPALALLIFEMILRQTVLRKIP